MNFMCSRRGMCRVFGALVLCAAIFFGMFFPKGIIRAEEQSDPLGDFVTRAYDLILDREPDPDGYAFWYKGLKSGEMTAAHLVNGFMISSEMYERHLTEDAQIDILYHVMFDRDADEAGKKYWLQYMEDGFSISSVVDGFTKSEEFLKVCEAFGITPGNVEPVENRDKNQGVTKYVSRVYKILLGRRADIGGLNYWTGGIGSGALSAAEIVNEFINTSEFLKNDYDNDTVLNYLYEAMLGREIDPAGKESWTMVLGTGVTMSCIVNQIAESPEFAKLCNQYGMVPGKVDLKAPRDQNYQLCGYISQAYPLLVGRPVTAAELDNYVGAAMNGQKKVEDILCDMVKSPESQAYHSNNNNFLAAAFQVCYGHDGSAGQYSAYRISLNNGISRAKVITLIAKNSAFTDRLKAFGIENVITVPKKIIALTWDDGPWTPVTMPILDVLEKYGAHGTFFVEGDRVYTYRNCIVRAINMGCEIGNHTWDHTTLTKLDAAGVRMQISKTNNALYNLTGIWPKLMRPVGGNRNATVDANVGMPEILWSVDTNDWKYRNTQHVIDVVLKNAKDGDIILMHDLYSTTAEAVKVIVPALIERGFTLVTVSELAEYRGVTLKDGTPYYSLRG